MGDISADPRTTADPSPGRIGQGSVGRDIHWHVVGVVAQAVPIRLRHHVLARVAMLNLVKLDSGAADDVRMGRQNHDRART